MAKLLKITLIVFAILVFAYAVKNLSGAGPAIKPAPKPGVKKTDTNTTGMPLKLAPGFSISIFADGLGGPRDLELDPEGTLLVSVPREGKVLALPSANTKVTVVEGLNLPHGLAFGEGKLFIAETNQVASYDYDPKTFKATNKKKIIDLPGGGNHFTRSILIKDNKTYVSTGSSCNACLEKDSRRAAIWVSNLDGSEFKAYGVGLRNSVFMTLKPGANEIWATEMGRDLLGDNVPAEEINIIREGHYGWPYCYENKTPDRETNPDNSKFDCSTTIAPTLTFQAHSAPLGLAFWEGDLLVAYHGSWNRSVPTGYQVVRFRDGKEEDFISGWLQDGSALGRPVDIIVANPNTIYISDDKAGVVYEVIQN